MDSHLALPQPIRRCLQRSTKQCCGVNFFLSRCLRNNGRIYSSCRQKLIFTLVTASLPFFAALNNAFNEFFIIA